MKWKHVGIALLIVVVIALALAGAEVVRAEEPQPWMAPMLKCSGLSMPQLEFARQDFDTQYGFDHALVTDWQWKASFEARTNELAALLGCPRVIEEGWLTRWYRFYAPTYTRIVKNVPE